MVVVTNGKAKSSESTTSSRSEPMLCWTPPMSASLILAHALCGLVAFVMADAARGFTTKESALAFYGVYHREPINQLIHFVGVPGIIFSLFVFQFHVGPTFFLVPFHKLTIRGLPAIPPHAVNWATLYAIFYLIFYLSIDQWGAIL
jgi:hypothetical protein